jgi:hypothetical protein
MRLVVEPILDLPHDRQAFEVVEMSLNDLVLALCYDAWRRDAEASAEEIDRQSGPRPDASALAIVPIESMYLPDPVLTTIGVGPWRSSAVASTRPSVTEGFEMRDLKEAKALLEELAA